MGNKHEMKNKHTDSSALDSAPELNLEGSLEQPNHTRRRAMFGAAAGASLVAWQTPVVKSVILPAHAQTSGDVDPPPPPPPAPAAARAFLVSAASPVVNAAPRSNSLLDAFIPTAVAGAAMAAPVYTYTISAVETGDESNVFDITVLERVENPDSILYTAVESVFMGQVDGPGTGSLALSSAGCDDAPMDAISANIVSVSDTAMQLEFTNREAMFELVAGEVMIPSPMCEMVPLAESYFQPGGNAMMGAAQPEGVLDSVLNALVPEAHAGIDPMDDNFGILATNMGGGNFLIDHLNPAADVIRSGTVNIDGSTGNLSFDMGRSCDNLEGTPSDIPCRILSIDETVMNLEITRSRGGTVTLSVSAGSGMLEAFCEQIQDN